MSDLAIWGDIMSLTAVDKMKLNRYLKEHAANDIYYLEMCDYLGKRGKIADIEFLEYFVETVATEFRKNEKISSKQIIKMISIIDAFLGWMFEEKSPIGDVVLDQIRSFNDFYDEYLIKSKMNVDQKVIENLALLKETLDKLYPPRASEDSVSKYLNKIAELEVKIKQLERDLDEIKRIKSGLEKRANQVETLQDNNNALSKEIKVKSLEIKNLTETIASLQSKIQELELLLSQSKKKVSDLEDFKVRYETISEEVKKLQALVNSDKKAKLETKNLEEKQSKIERLIYQKLLIDEASLDELVKYMQSQGITTDNAEIIKILKRVKQKINIGDSSFSMSPIYRVQRPILVTDKFFSVNVPYDAKYYDIMLVSDLHLKKFDSKVLKGFDSLNDYCTKHGICLILDLGDFYDGYGASKKVDHDSAIKNYQLVEQAISFIPKASGLYHAVLGGNHDCNVSNYGFDPIELLARERDDFLNLGYFHSTILLNNLTNNLGSFDIHHPNNFTFSVNLDENGVDIEGTISYLKELYTKQGRNRDDSYIDIFGHTHQSQFNYPGSYCFIPPFFDGGSKKGACHLRIYFDENNDIKYMIFMPLSYSDNKLVKKDEIVYQKILTK